MENWLQFAVFAVCVLLSGALSVVFVKLNERTKENEKLQKAVGVAQAVSNEFLEHVKASLEEAAKDGVLDEKEISEIKAKLASEGISAGKVLGKEFGNLVLPNVLPFVLGKLKK